MDDSGGPLVDDYGRPMLRFDMPGLSAAEGNTSQAGQAMEQGEPGTADELVQYGVGEDVSDYSKLDIDHLDFTLFDEQTQHNLESIRHDADFAGVAESVVGDVAAVYGISEEEVRRGMQTLLQQAQAGDPEKWKAWAQRNLIWLHDMKRRR